jgi:hypothetical protein
MAFPHDTPDSFPPSSPLNDYVMSPFAVAAAKAGGSRHNAANKKEFKLIQ